MNTLSFPWPKGIKKTRSRQLLLAVLEQADRPLSAREIGLALEQQGESVWLSTIYRTLERFTEQGVLMRTMLLDDDTALYQMQPHPHMHYAICMDCHQTLPIAHCPLEGLHTQMDTQRFHVIGHKVELYGYCERCEKKRQP